MAFIEEIYRPRDRHLGRPPDRWSPGRCRPWCSQYFFLPSDLFRPPTCLGLPPSPRERPGNTRTGRLLARGRAPGGMGISRAAVWMEVGITAAWFVPGIWIVGTDLAPSPRASPLVTSFQTPPYQDG